MTVLGGSAGIQAGSFYAFVQSAAMGGAATGIVATIGGMSIGSVAAAVVVPAVVVGKAAMALV